jgi:hypothetical protein
LISAQAAFWEQLMQVVEAPSANGKALMLFQARCCGAGNVKTDQKTGACGAGFLFRT